VQLETQALVIICAERMKGEKRNRNKEPEGLKERAEHTENP